MSIEGKRIDALEAVLEPVALQAGKYQATVILIRAKEHTMYGQLPDWSERPHSERYWKGLDEVIRSFDPWGARSFSLFLLTGKHATVTRWPNHYHWHDLPFIGGPYSRLGDMRLRGANASRCLGTRSEHPDPMGALDTLQALGGVRLVIIEQPIARNHGDFEDKVSCAARDLVDLLELAGVTTPPRVVIVTPGFDASRFQDGTPVMARALANKEAKRPWDRFLWTYMVNFQPLAERLFQHALQVTHDLPVNPPTSLLRGSYPPQGEWRALSNPWAMQILFALSRSAKTPVREEGNERLPWWPEDPRDEVRQVWAGTGAYPAAVVYWSRSEDTMEDFVRSDHSNTGSDPDAVAAQTKRRHLRAAAAEAPEFWDGFQPAMEALKRLGMITDGCSLPEGRLTRRGELLVSLMPPQFGDPDLMLRWRGENGRPADKDIPAMDRWLQKAFRALKVRANELTPG